MPNPDNAFCATAASQLERAMRSLLVNQGKGDWENTFRSNDKRDRVLPNRTIISPGVRAVKGYRPEGTVQLEIQHIFPISDPNNPNGAEDPAMALEWIGETLDTINMENPPSQNMGKLADALTVAGRWLAVEDGTPKGNQVAADNADMVDFRVDWVRFAEIMYTRGKSEGADGSLTWVEIIHLEAFVSQASAALPN